MRKHLFIISYSEKHCTRPLKYQKALVKLSFKLARKLVKFAAVRSEREPVFN